MEGKFIVLAGIGGSGKSTTMDFLRTVLDLKLFLPTREPGGDLPFLQEFRRVFKGEWEPPLNAWEHMLMVESMRSYHMRHEVLPALARGLHVVCDRFSESTQGYQIYGQQASEGVRQMFHEIDKRSRFGREPDLYVYFKIPVTVAMERHRRREGGDDFFDEQKGLFQERVGRGIWEYIQFRPHRLVDAEQTPEALHKEVLAIVMEACRF